MKNYTQIQPTDGPCYNEDQTYISSHDASTPKMNRLQLDDTIINM